MNSPAKRPSPHATQARAAAAEQHPQKSIAYPGLDTYLWSDFLAGKYPFPPATETPEFTRKWNPNPDP